MKHHIIVSFELPGALPPKQRQKLSIAFFNALQLLLVDDPSEGRIPASANYVNPADLPRTTNILVYDDPHTGVKKMWHLEGTPPGYGPMHAAHEMYSINEKTGAVTMVKCLRPAPAEVADGEG
jgi:hypothetical protein